MVEFQGLQIKLSHAPAVGDSYKIDGNFDGLGNNVNMRASLAVVVVIPLSLLATFMGLKIMGVPANLLSLGAMDFGIIVDGAVIVVENIMHRLAERGEGMNEKERRTLITLSGGVNTVQGNTGADSITVSGGTPFCG